MVVAMVVVVVDILRLLQTSPPVLREGSSDPWFAFSSFAFPAFTLSLIFGRMYL